MAATPTQAHTTGVSYSDIQVRGRTARMHLRINLQELRFVDQLDLNQDRLISREEVSQALPRFIPRLIESYRIQTPAEAGRSQLVYWRQGPGPGELECLIRYHFAGEIVRLQFTVALQNLTDSGHWNLATVRHSGGREDLTFNLENPRATLEVGRGWRLSWQRTLRGLASGAQDVIASPLLIGFLLGLLLTVPNRGSLVRSVAAFAAAQGLMTGLTILGLVRLPGAFLASATALSLAYIASENLLVKETANRWAIAGFFGLLFGADLSSPLAAQAEPVSAAAHLGWILGASAAVASAASLIFLITQACQGRPWHSSLIRLTSVLLLGVGLVGFFYRIL